MNKYNCNYGEFHLDFAKYSDYCAYCGHSPIIMNHKCFTSQKMLENMN